MQELRVRLLSRRAWRGWLISAVASGLSIAAAATVLEGKVVAVTDAAQLLSFSAYFFVCGDKICCKAATDTSPSLRM